MDSNRERTCRGKDRVISLTKEKSRNRSEKSSKNRKSHKILNKMVRTDEYGKVLEKWRHLKSSRAVKALEELLMPSFEWKFEKRGEQRPGCTSSGR